MSFLFDIETQPRPDEVIEKVIPPFDESSVKTGNCGPEKAKEKIEAKRQEYLAEQKDKAALDARTSSVLVITYRFPNGETQIAEDREDKLLIEFWLRIRQVIRNHAFAIGFNCHDFDLPYLVRRSWLCQSPEVIVPGAVINDWKWWNRSLVDVVQVWRLGQFWTSDAAKTGGLDRFSRLFGLSGKTEDSGKLFYQIYSEDRERAMTYCTTEMDCLEAVASGIGVWKRSHSTERGY